MTSTEETISAICAEIVGVAHIDIDDNLFDLGSDSHQAVLVALEIERRFGVDLPLEVLETSASVRALSAWIDAEVSRQGLAQAPAQPSRRD